MIHEALEWVAIVVDGAAVIVMLVGFVLAIVKFVPAFALELMIISSDQRRNNTQ